MSYVVNEYKPRASVEVNQLAGTIAGGASAPGYSHKHPPAPLVRVARHPLKWTLNKLRAIADGLVLNHLGLFIVVAVYYLVWETGTFNWLWSLFGWHSGSTALWHSLVPDSLNRHNVRDVGEGFLGGCLGQMVIWNHYRKGAFKKPHLLDKAEHWLRIPNVKYRAELKWWQYPYGFGWALIYGLPGFFLGTWLVNKIFHAFHYVAPFVNSHSAYYQKALSIWTGSAPHIVIGLSASVLAARRPLLKLYDDIQLNMVQRRVALNKPVHWYHSPTFKARYTDELPQAAPIKEAWHGSANTVPTLIVLGSLAGIALAGYGYYVLTVIAVRGH